MTQPPQRSDEDLISAIESWKATRRARWDAVASQRGAAYEEAFGRYMDEKRTADAILAEARRRGLRRGGRPRQSPRPADPAGLPPFDYDVELVDDRLVRATADGAVQLEDVVRRPLAEDLRAGLRGLRIDPGEVLHGRFSGRLPTTKTDVENRLLLNISVPTSCLRGGFAFEHDPRIPEGSLCGYEYRPVRSDEPFASWRAESAPLFQCRDVPLPNGLSAPAVWWHVRRGRVDGRLEHDVPTRLLLRVSVTSPRALNLDELKSVTDGLLAAAQSMPSADPLVLDPFLRRLRAAGIETDPVTAAGILRDADGATLGPATGLITRDGRVDPDDHLVVAGVVAVALEHGSRLRLSADVYAATPASHVSAR